MPHKSSNSFHSIASSLTSLSSQASVELYEERLKPRINTIRKSDATLQELIDIAEKLVREEFAPDSKSTFTYKKDDEEISVQLDEVMTAMLACADECGGESGRRYVAAAIFGCSEEEDVVGALAGLGTTWLTHLLFIFKTSRGHANQPNKSPSLVATPTADQTASHLLKGMGNRKTSFADDVMKRDGYTCVLTGSQDLSHPKPTEGNFRTGLVVAHILRRAIGQFDNDHTSDSYRSALTTFDILLNFTRLPAQTLQELRDELDNPSNGMALQHDAHAAFDRFDWCLKKTEKEHVYDLKIFEDQGILRKPENNLITFEDHSNDFSDFARKLKRSAPIDLPNPRYIEIHAAIAGILNMSGAGRFFDELLDKYKDDEGNVPAVRSWPELETLMGADMLSESLSQAFQSVKVR